MSPVEVHHLVDGPVDAPVVVLANSIGSTHRMWDPQVPVLAERYRVIRFDNRGHGESPVPPGPYTMDDLAGDELALLDRLGVADAHLVGLSLGGMMSMTVAAAHPERVRSLGLLCTSALLGPAQMWRDRATTAREQGMGALGPAGVARWLSEPFSKEHPDVVADVQAMLESTPPEGYAAACSAIEKMDLRDRLPSISAPTLAVAGSEDPATPPEHLRLIADAIPGARLAVLDGAAHMATIEQPDAGHRAAARAPGPDGGGAMTDTDDAAYERGLRVRREVLGDAHVDRALESADALSQPFQDLITRYAWGDVWGRDGLDRRTRSMLTLALLAALGHEHELAMHVRAAVRNGVTPDEIGEVLLHTAVYAGVPVANRALVIAREALADES